MVGDIASWYNDRLGVPVRLLYLIPGASKPNVIIPVGPFILRASLKVDPDGLFCNTKSRPVVGRITKF